MILTEILQGIKNDRDFVSVKKYLLEFPIFGPKGIENDLALLHKDADFNSIEACTALRVYN